MVIFFLLVLLGSVHGKVDVHVEPTDPLPGEIFDLVFRVKGKGTPRISFNPSGAKVVGKRKGSTSTSTVIINGKVNTTRESSYIFKLTAKKPMTVRIGNIVVEMNGKTYQHRDLIVNVRKSRSRKKSQGSSRDTRIFIRVIPSKRNLYEGEGVSLDYYLYSNMSLSGFEVRQYPKLNGFIKRFYTPSQNVERVEHQGSVYQRSRQYSARLYPEKSGVVYVDPLKLDVQYKRGHMPNPFFSIGGFGRLHTIAVQNEPIPIKVKSIPKKGRPDNFTHLVGKHSFKISLNKRKFLANEAIELKFEVEGEGALENYDAPSFYLNPDLEEFSKKSKIIKIDNVQAKKLFDYTFLARKSLEIKDRKMTLYTFNPNDHRFEGISLVVPGLMIAGGATPVPITPPEKEEKINEVYNKEKRSLIAPTFKTGFKNYQLISILNIFLAFILIIQISFFVFTFFKKRKSLDEIDLLIKSMKKEGLSYSKLYKLFLKINPALGTTQQMVSLESLIENSTLSQESKRYFKEIIDKSERASFKDNEGNLDIKYNESFFNELKSTKISHEIN